MLATPRTEKEPRAAVSIHLLATVARGLASSSQGEEGEERGEDAEEEQHDPAGQGFTGGPVSPSRGGKGRSALLQDLPTAQEI